jgi:hypothetical protein
VLNPISQDNICNWNTWLEFPSIFFSGVTIDPAWDAPINISRGNYLACALSKKVMAFPVLSRDVTNQTLPDSDIPARDGKNDNLF